MDRRSVRYWIGAVCLAAAAEALCCAAALPFLRHFGGFLALLPGNAVPEDAVLWFNGLRYAELEPAPILPFLLCLGGVVLTDHIRHGAGEAPQRSRNAALIAAAVLLAAFAATVWLTKADGVLFGNMLDDLRELKEAGFLSVGP